MEESYYCGALDLVMLFVNIRYAQAQQGRYHRSLANTSQERSWLLGRPRRNAEAKMLVPFEENTSPCNHREQQHNVPHHPEHRSHNSSCTMKNMFGQWSVSSRLSRDYSLAVILLPWAVALFVEGASIRGKQDM